jgi:small-conductance mechanosensitive channel
MTENVFFDRIKGFFNYTLFTVNQTPITFSSLILFLFLLIVFLIISKILTRTLGTRVLSRLSIDEGTRYNLERITQYILGIIGAIVAFQFIGIDLSGLAVIFGLLSVGIGFGLQNVTSNFVAGLILLFERPIKVGDRVSIGDTEGDVLAINLRSTTIRSIDNIAIIVPNSDFISNSVTNWSYGDKKIRLNVEVGVSYNSDLDTVLRCLKEVALENNKVMKSPKPEVHLMEFGDSSWNMKLRCWVSDPKEHRRIASDLNCAIVHKFRENSVEIPFPQRDLHVRSSVPLQTSGL